MTFLNHRKINGKSPTELCFQMPLPPSLGCINFNAFRDWATGLTHSVNFFVVRYHMISCTHRMHDCHCISPSFVPDGLQETLGPGGLQESAVPDGLQETVVPGGIQEAGVPGIGLQESFVLKRSPQKAIKGAFVCGGIDRTEHVGPLDFRSIRISK